jgi:formate hydrogenlyase subunit 4
MMVGNTRSMGLMAMRIALILASLMALFSSVVSAQYTPVSSSSGYQSIATGIQTNTQNTAGLLSNTTADLSLYIEPLFVLAILGIIFFKWILPAIK